MLDSNASSPIRATEETSTQTSTETQTQIAVKRGTKKEKLQIQPAEESPSQVVDESEIFVSGNTRIPSANETRTLTLEVTAETKSPLAEETRTRTLESTKTGATVEKSQTQATTESTNLARDETQIQPPEETYTRTEDFDVEFPETYEAEYSEESGPSILNGRDISIY